MDPEFFKALELVANYDRQRLQKVKEYRVYYDETGRVTGMWETDHPMGNYVIITDPGLFHNNNTEALRAVDNELKLLDLTAPMKVRLVKSTKGFAVVRGHAAIILGPGESYEDTEYYDRKTDY